LFLGTVVDAATLKAKVSPVQKVIELLDDLAGKVKGDLAKENPDGGIHKVVRL
jgi:hypothetical protein